MSSSSPIKLGILSTAMISDAIVTGVKAVPTCVCTAIASRSVERAKAYARIHDIPTACTYEELLEQPIDAVYIPLPTALATDWAVRFASAGIHVLCDKPFDSVQGVQRILDACEERNVYFMDATHFAHNSRTRKVIEKIRSGSIGDVKRVISTFSIPTPIAGNIRSDPKLEPAAAVGDLGWYVMRSAVAFLGAEITSNVQSVRVTGRYHPDFEGVAECAEGIVEFGTGAADRITLSFNIDYNGSAIQQSQILGTMGSIDVQGFVVPPRQTQIYDHLRPSEDYTTDVEIFTTMSVTEFAGPGHPVLIYPTTEREVVHEHEGLTQVSMMMREFSRMILERDDDAARKWAKDTITTQTLVDAAFEEFKQNAAR